MEINPRNPEKNIICSVLGPQMVCEFVSKTLTSTRAHLGLKKSYLAACNGRKTPSARQHPWNESRTSFLGLFFCLIRVQNLMSAQPPKGVGECSRCSSCIIGSCSAKISSTFNSLICIIHITCVGIIVVFRF